MCCFLLFSFVFIRLYVPKSSKIERIFLASVEQKLCEPLLALVPSRVANCTSPRPKKTPQVGQQAVRVIPSAVSQPWEVQPNSRSQLGTSHFFNQPVAPAEATEEVHRLEAALSALGKGNQLAKTFVEALRIARSKSFLREEQIIACKNFVERLERRVSRVETVIFKALEQGVR